MDGGTETLTRDSERIAESRTARLDDQGGTEIVAPMLVAVDMSGDSQAALLWACEHAARANAPLTILHVLHDPPEAPGKYSRNAPDPLTPMTDTAERMLSEFIAEVHAGRAELERLLKARTKTVNGLPARTIIDEALRLNASLIVMGSRGQTGLPRLLFGSTAQRVAQLSPIPVTVVKDQR